MDRNVTLPVLWQDRWELFSKEARSRRIVVEVGVQRGASARIIYDIARPEHMYLIDMWSPANKASTSRNLKYLGLTRGRFKDTTNVDVIVSPMDKCADMVPCGVDFIHWDAGVEEPISLGLELYWPKLKVGGVMVVRGYTPWNPVNRVFEAVTAIEDKYGDVFEVGITNETSSARSVLLRRT